MVDSTANNKLIQAMRRQFIKEKNEEYLRQNIKLRDEIYNNVQLYKDDIEQYHMNYKDICRINNLQSIKWQNMAIVLTSKVKDLGRLNPDFMAIMTNIYLLTYSASQHGYSNYIVNDIPPMLLIRSFNTCHPLDDDLSEHTMTWISYNRINEFVVEYKLDIFGYEKILKNVMKLCKNGKTFLFFYMSNSMNQYQLSLRGIAYANTSNIFNMEKLKQNIKDEISKCTLPYSIDKVIDLLKSERNNIMNDNKPYYDIAAKQLYSSIVMTERVFHRKKLLLTANDETARLS